MQYVEFMVNDRPLVCWDWRLQEKNLDYLRGIDTTFFSYVLEANMPHIESEKKTQAALAIRIAYYQALEMLFALLCSAIQAPNCVVGWNLAYKNHELYSVVEKVAKNQSLYSHERYRPVSWENMAKHVFAFLPWPAEKVEWLQSGFGRMWSGLAREFIDTKNSMEYNALKHGLRPRPGGFRMAFGPQSDPKVPCPPEKMRSLGGSETGSSFFLNDRIGRQKSHFRPRSVAKNWSTSNTANGLGLISMSIEDVVSFLRIENGDKPEECRFRTPDAEEAFKAPWSDQVGVMWSSIDTTIAEEDIEVWTNEEIERHLSPEG